MKPEFISRDKMMKSLAETLPFRTASPLDRLELIAAVCRIEVANVRPVVTARWEIDNSYAGPGLINLRCSACGEFGGTWKDNTLPHLLYRFCPNCGADMREDAPG